MTEPIHFSDLKLMSLSPAHYKQRISKRTTSLHKGSALHAMMFDTADVLLYEGRRAGKEWKEFAEEHADALIMIQSEMSPVMGMANALRNCPEAMMLLDGTQEQTIDWTWGGRDWQGTPDVFNQDRVVELKTTRTSHPDRFYWEARRYSYFSQLALYRHGLTECGLARPKKAYVVAVENSPPHNVTCFEVSDRALDQGDRTWRLWFEQLRVCEESNHWPGYAQNIVMLDIPDEDEPFRINVDGEEMEV